MIDFMVIALPRSGTAWVSNLLTTDDLVCVHEALISYTLAELDALSVPHMLGIAETSGAYIADEINQHSAKKLVITRPIAEINNSAIRLGFEPLSDDANSLLDKVDGYRIEYKNLFDYKEMSKAYEYLCGKHLDPLRHALLCDLRIENIAAIDAVRSMV